MFSPSGLRTAACVSLRFQAGNLEVAEDHVGLVCLLNHERPAVRTLADGQVMLSVCLDRGENLLQA